MKETLRPGTGTGPLPTVIQTPRGPVECVVSGEGPVILALHGAMGGYDQGLLLVRTTIASSQFRCVSVSRPGYLGTPLESGERLKIRRTCARPSWTVWAFKTLLSSRFRAAAHARSSLHCAIATAAGVSCCFRPALAGCKHPCLCPFMR